MNFCPSCGAKRLRPQDQFCMNCGQKYPKLEEATPDVQAPGPNVQEQAAQLTSSIDQMLGGAPGTMPAEGFEGEPARVQPSQAFRQQAAGQPLESERPTGQDIAPPAGQGLDAVEQPLQPEQPANLFDVALPEVDAPAEPAGDVWQQLDGGEAPAIYAPVEEAPAAESLFDPQQQQPAQPEYVQAAPAQDMFGVDGDNDGDLFGGSEGPSPQQSAGQRQQYQAPPQQAQRQAAQQPRQPAQSTAQAPVERSSHSELLGRQEETRPVGEAEQEAKWRKLQNADNLQALYEQNEQRERKKPPEIQLPPYEEKPPRKPRKKKGPSIGLIIAAVLVFVVGTLGATLGLLYYNNSSGKAINSFVTALQEKDHTALRSISQPGSGVTFSTEGLNALSDAFSAPADRVELERQLKRQASGDSASETYQAIQLKSEKLFLFVNRYYIEIVGVEILAEGEHAGELYLNGALVLGTDTAEGMLYSNLMPGTYGFDLMVNGMVTRSGTTTAFTTASPNKLGSNDVGSGTTSQTATVTVENCISDEGIIYVAGNEVSEKPVGGIVTLPNVALGSEIRIEIPNSEGGGQRSSVVFSDLSSPNLRFGEYTEITDEPETPESEPENEPNENEQIAEDMATAEMNDVLETFYRSYLKSINDQTTDTLEKSTSANTSAMASRITSDSNAANTFEFVSIAIDAESIHRSEENGVPSIKFNATFSSTYTPRDNSAGSTSLTNRQTVQLIYHDGEWKVNAMTFVSDDQYSKRELAL